MNNNKRIALTIDDLPYEALSPDDKLKEGVEITNLLLQHLKQNDVKVTGFVIGKIADESAKDNLLEKWHLNGHLLANHTYSHLRLSNLSSGDFEKDVIKNEKILAPYWENNPVKYFRFPYLDYGNTIEQRRKALDFLHQRSYTVVSITINTEDYIYNESYTEAWLNNDAKTMQYAINKYLEYVKKIVEFREQQAMCFFDRPMGHIMLIHANRINAYSVGRVITLLKRKGYEFVSLQEILKDPCFWQNYAKIYNPQYMSWQKQSGDGKSEWINYPNIDPEILETYNNN